MPETAVEVQDPVEVLRNLRSEAYELICASPLGGVIPARARVPKAETLSGLIAAIQIVESETLMTVIHVRVFAEGRVMSRQQKERAASSLRGLLHGIVSQALTSLETIEREYLMGKSFLDRTN